MAVTVFFLLALGALAVSERGRIIEAAAKALDAPSYCLATGDPYSEAGCLSEMAELRRDPELCSLLPAGDTHERCVSYTAQKMKDARLCGRLLDVRDRASCFALIARYVEADVCSPVTSERDRPECYAASIQIAAETRQASRCERLADAAIRVRCLGAIGRVYRPEAALEACKALTDPSEQVACAMRLLEHPPPGVE